MDAMATVFRAIVMLVVLVGLPAAWVYYGPLPAAAVGVIQRTVRSAKQSFGWEESATATVWAIDSPKTAPRFAPTATHATQTLQQRAEVELAAQPLASVMRDSQFSLASATVPATRSSAITDSASVEADLARQLEPHLSVLRSLNAAEYTLENWGGSERLYRFRCAIALGENDDHTRQFEAIHADPLRAVHQIVGEVTSWQNARHTEAPTHWR